MKRVLIIFFLSKPKAECDSPTSLSPDLFTIVQREVREWEKRRQAGATQGGRRHGLCLEGTFHPQNTSSSPPPFPIRRYAFSSPPPSTDPCVDIAGADRRYWRRSRTSRSDSGCLHLPNFGQARPSKQASARPPPAFCRVRVLIRVLIRVRVQGPTTGEG